MYSGVSPTPTLK